MKRKAESSIIESNKRITASDINWQEEENSDDNDDDISLVEILSRACVNKTDTKDRLTETLPLPDTSDTLESFCSKAQALQRAIADCNAGKTTFVELTGSSHEPKDYEAQELACMTKERADLYQAWKTRGAEELAREGLILDPREWLPKKKAFGSTGVGRKMREKVAALREIWMVGEEGKKAKQEQVEIDGRDVQLIHVMAQAGKNRAAQGTEDLVSAVSLVARARRRAVSGRKGITPEAEAERLAFKRVKDVYMKEYTRVMRENKLRVEEATCAVHALAKYAKDMV